MSKKNDFVKMIRETNPPFPYNKCLRMFFLKPIMNNYTKENEYFTLDSRKLFNRNATNLEKQQGLLKLKSPWFNAKWLYYNYGNKRTKPSLCSTSNQFRDKMNIDPIKYGDIGIPKIKYYVGDDPQKDIIISRLLEGNFLPRLTCNSIDSAYYAG